MTTCAPVATVEGRPTCVPNALKTKRALVHTIIEALTVHTCIENVRHHIEEEDEWFPKVREGLGRKALQEIGEEMLAAKERPVSPPSPAP